MFWFWYVVFFVFFVVCMVGDVYYWVEVNIFMDVMFLSLIVQFIIWNVDGLICYGFQLGLIVDDDIFMSIQFIGFGGLDNEIFLGGRNLNVFII